MGPEEQSVAPTRALTQIPSILLGPCSVYPKRDHLSSIQSHKAFFSLSLCISHPLFLCIYRYFFLHPLEYSYKHPVPAKNPLNCFVPLLHPSPTKTSSGSGFSGRSAVYLLCGRTSERAPFEDPQQCHWLMLRDSPCLFKWQSCNDSRRQTYWWQDPLDYFVSDIKRSSYTQWERSRARRRVLPHLNWH